MSAESPRHARSGGPLTVPAQPPSDRSLIDAVSGFINDVTLSSTAQDPKDVIQWARFETADINEPTPEGDSDNDISPLLLILGYGSGVQVWLIPPSGEAQEVLSWRQGTVRVLRILPTPQHGDAFAPKRPLIALCDSASPGPSFCSLSFISIRGGEQVKSIKFKNPILDVLANKRSVVVSFSERFAVFDAATLEDRLAVTTCYPCPCPLGGSAPINPLALGDRWLAYADKKLNQSKRSSGGCEGEGQTSYTATVLHAAKSLSKGLRGLGESVAHSLAGTRSASQSPSPPAADAPHPGLVTILDIEANDDEDVGQDTEEPCDPIVAHFVAHSEAIIAMKFDPSGMLLVTADRRGHDFHVFRINPHPCGPSLASVHHLYILHRGDTTAKVQDIAISLDSRWVAISTLRGTTHLFAMSPYGGACAVRTHTAPRVVNRLSRFHRSAGLPIHAGHAHAHTHHSTGSPVSDGIAGAWFPNPRLPPYPVPTVNTPLAQLRPTAALPTHTITRTSSGRQRLSSVSEESGVAPLLARARFGVAGVPAAERGGAGLRAQASAALYLMAASGCLSHIALHPRPARNVPKEKISDDTSIELEVEPVAQWPLQRPPAAADLLAPLPPGNPLLQPLSCRRMADMCMSEEERWLSQVEIVTHAGPHRRLWMGPQFVFKTYNCTGSNSSLSEAEAVEIEAGGVVGGRGEVARSNPVNVPAAARPLVPVLVDSGSASSLEHSPSDNFRRKSLLAESGRVASVCDVQLKEDLAEAMKEDHGGREVEARGARRSLAVSRAVDPLGTVVAPAEPSPGGPVSSPPDDDAHTRSNDDEATFRPVVRAPAPPDHHPELELARPLPHTTTIPVQSISALEPPTPPEPHPLSTDVIIPAALTPVPWSAPELDHPETDQPEAVEKPEVPHRPPPSPRETDDGRKRSPKPEKREPVVEAKIPEPKNRTKEAKREETKEVAVEIEKTNKRRETSSKIEKTEAGPAATADNLVKLDESPAVVSTVDSVNVDIKSSDVNKDLRRQEIDGRPRDRGSAERAERVDSKSLPKSNRSSDDIQPTASVRLKKSPTPKSVSDRDSEASYKDKSKRNDESKDVIEPKELKETKELKEPKEIKKQKDVKDSRGKVAAVALSQEFKDIDLLQDRPVKKEPKEPIVNITKEPTVPTALKTFTKKEDTNSKKREEIEIKTEEQAWDMLLNEPQKPITLSISPPATEDKQKSKKNRKIKKNQEDVQAKTDDDSFVEIHAIEEKQQICSGELVSISSPFEDVDPTISYLSKIKKSRKSLTPEKREDSKSIELGPQEEPELLDFKLKSFKKYEDKDIEVLPSPAQVQKEIFKETTNNILKSKKHSDGTASESSSFFLKETPKPMKSKSLSPYPELRKHDKSVDIDKDVYVINTAEDDFPEIQITRGTKPRKRSPQPMERKSVERGEPVTDKPIKSWSSIAASKNVKKDEEKKVDIVERKYEKCDRDEETVSYPMSSTTASLQEKLFELCKRTDIMVAECDAPSELNFVDEHHAVLHDLPPLEPLDFGLDDFKLEVMRDSLLEVNDTKTTSPICKINIDDILSSIKETTAKAIESSAFNLIDLEKVPAKKEKGFSVIEEHKITSQEVKLDDDGKEEKEGEMEKSSEDDTSPVVSTDSDKEDRKNAGASNIVLPSLKQSAKSKKSRRKKK